MLRKVAALGVIFFIMANLSFFLGGRRYAGEEAVTIILGFVLLGSFFSAKIAARAMLPMLTGYLAFGFLAGPAGLHIITAAHVAHFSFINTLAFAYIALLAGGEIEWEFLRAHGVRVAGIGALNVAAVFGGVAAVFYLVLSAGYPATAAIPPALALYAALAMGAVAASTSPAATVAIVNETESKGELTESALGIVVTKDIAVITLFALVMSWVQSATGGGQGASTTAVLMSMVLEVFLSILVGGLVGAFVLLYLKTVGDKMLLFAFGVAVLSTVVASLFHLNELLICVVAGFMVRNFSGAGRKFRRAAEKGALPIFVIFFSLAGASLNMEALRLMWPLALGYFALRASLLAVATMAGTRLMNASPALTKWLWAAFISQAGVSLGLAMKVRDLFPQAGEALATLIIAEITLCELVGPVIFKRALVSAGETGKRGRTSTISVASQKGVAPAG